MARPAALTMKSMGNTTGLGPGAGVVVLCRFPVTLSAQSRGFGRRSRSTNGSGDPQAPSPTSFPAAFYRADRQSRLRARSARGPRVDSLVAVDSRAARGTALGKESRERAPSHPAKNLHSTTIPCQTASPAALYMKSMGNTTGLAPGAGVDALCRFPVTLSTHPATNAPHVPAPAPQTPQAPAGCPE